MNKKIVSRITYKLKLASEVDKINIKDNKKKTNFNKKHSRKKQISNYKKYNQRCG